MGLALAIGFGVGTHFGYPPGSASPEPVDDVVPGAVSEALRLAVSSTGGSAAVCRTDTDTSCGRASYVRSLRDFRDFTYFVSESEWSGISPTATTPGRVVVAAALGGVAASALLIRLDADAQPIDRTEITGIMPSADALFYFDLGTIEAGRYLLAIVSVQNGPTGGYVGATYLISIIAT